MRVIAVIMICFALSFSAFSQTIGTDLSDAEVGTVNFNHDYSQTVVMKIGLSIPDGKGGSRVFNTFENALEIIEKADKLSIGVPKIVYLVGWQYNGHDDKYPAFFEVNEALKRTEDSSGRESLLWLMREARKYNTIVSLHINMTDAYDDSPLWDEYVEKDMISKTPNGNLMVIGNYNNRKAYQINYKNEWECGYSKMRIDRLLELLPPLKEAKTIHIDAWISRESKGHYESAITEAKYQQRILKYWNDQGIDVTSEWVMDYMIGKIPFAWHFNAFSQENYIEYPANIYTGSGLNKDLEYTDFGLGFLFGKSMYGENVFPRLNDNPGDTAWQQKFVEEFFSNCLQYFYLNKLKRLKVEGEGNNRVAYFSENVKVSLADSSVYQNSRLLRSGNTLCFPVLWKNDNSLAAYSEKGEELTYALPESWNQLVKAEVFYITKIGLIKKEVVEIKGNNLKISIEAGKPMLIVAKK